MPGVACGIKKKKNFEEKILSFEHVQMFKYMIKGWDGKQHVQIYD